MNSIKTRVKIIAGFVLFLFVTCSVGMAQGEPKISGYVKSSFQHSQKISETTVSNARIKISGSIDNLTSYTVFIDGVRDDVLLDAFVNREIAGGLSVKVGQYKTPFSTDNLTAATKVSFINRPYTKNDTSPAFRDKGVQFTYKNKYFDAMAAALNGSGQNNSEYNNNKTMAYRFVAKVLPQLNVTGNYATGNNSPADDETDDFVNVGANGNVAGVEYSAEFARMKHGDLTKSAYFAWLSYDFDMSSELITMLTPALRVEMSDPDDDMDDDAKSRYTIGLTAQMAQKFANRIMVNYEVRDVETGETDNMLGLEYQVTF
jgi:hypothetical protein